MRAPLHALTVGEPTKSPTLITVKRFVLTVGVFLTTWFLTEAWRLNDRALGKTALITADTALECEPASLIRDLTR